MKDFEDALLDLSTNILSAEQNRYRASNTKAMTLITITGVLTTLLINIGVHSDRFAMIAFASTIFFMFLTVVCGIIVISPRNVETLSTQHLIDDLSDEDHGRQIRGIIGTIARVEDSFVSANDSKAFFNMAAVISLGLSIISMLVYSFVVFYC